MWCGQCWKVQPAIKSKALCWVTYEREILNEMQFINIRFSKKKKQTYWITYTRCLFICERPIEAHISVALFIKQHGTAENQSKKQQAEEDNRQRSTLLLKAWFQSSHGSPRNTLSLIIDRFQTFVNKVNCSQCQPNQESVILRHR